MFEKEYENYFDDYRYEDVEEEENFINEKLSKLPTHQIIKQIKIDGVLWDFNAVSVYPSAMFYEISVHPRIETGYAFTKDLNKELVKKIFYQTFTKSSAILKNKYDIPKKLIVQHLPFKKREKKIEIIRMRNG